jgi:hypothetical protein
MLTQKVLQAAAAYPQRFGNFFHGVQWGHRCSVVSALEISIRDLAARYSVLAPHLHNAVTIIKGHDWLPSVSPRLLQQLEFDNRIVAAVTIGSHVKNGLSKVVDKAVLTQPPFGRLTHPLWPSRHKDDVSYEPHAANKIGHVLDRRIIRNASKEGVPIFGLFLNVRKPMRYVGQGAVNIYDVALARCGIEGHG